MGVAKTSPWWVVCFFLCIRTFHKRFGWFFGWFFGRWLLDIQIYEGFGWIYDLVYHFVCWEIVGKGLHSFNTSQGHYVAIVVLMAGWTSRLFEWPFWRTSREDSVEFWDVFFPRCSRSPPPNNQKRWNFLGLIFYTQQLLPRFLLSIGIYV